MGVKGTSEFSGSPHKYPRSDKVRPGNKTGDDALAGGAGQSNVDSFMDGSGAEKIEMERRSGGRKLKVGGGR